MNKLGFVVIVIAALGCGKSGGKASTGSGVAVDAAAVNSLVPPPLKDKLVFEKREIVIKRGRHSNTTYTVAAPKDWKQGMESFGSLEPTSHDVGFGTKFSVDSNCDGSCEPKEWEKVADKVNFAPYAKGKVLKDTKSPGHRTMIVEDDSHATNIIVAWWGDGDKNYHTCTAQLPDELKGAVPAFEKACQAVNVDGDD